MAEAIDVDLAELTRLAKQAGGDMNKLTEITKQYGKSAHVQHQTVSLRQARDLLKAAGNNAEIVKATLKGMGVATKYLTILMGRLHADIDKSRRKALEFESIWTRMFSPRTVWYASHAMNVVQKGFQGLQFAMGGPLGLAKGVINSGIDMGKGLLDSVIDAAQFRQNALTGMSYMLGGDMQKARELFADAQKLASKTPLDTNKVIQGIKTFLTSGFNASESKYLYRVVADQAAKFLDQPEVEGNVIGAFTRLQGRGYATNEDFESLRAAKFKVADVKKQLLQQKGFSDLMKKAGVHITGKESEEEQGKKIEHVLSTGKVGTYTLINAAIASLYQGKDLDTAGKLAEQFGGESLTGAISNAKNAFGDMLASLDLIKTEVGPDGVGKGMKALVGFLGRYSDLLGKAEGPGLKLRQTITGLVDELLLGLDLIDDKKMAAVIDSAGELGHKLIGFFKEAWGWLDKLINAKPGELINNAKGVLRDMGRYIGEGVAAGMKAAVTSAIVPDFLRDDPNLTDLAAESQERTTRINADVVSFANESRNFAKELQGGQVTGSSTAYEAARKAYLATEGARVDKDYDFAFEKISAGKGKSVSTAPYWAQTAEAPKIELPSSTPSFAAGGTVGGDGPMGSAQLVIAHKGEHFNGVNNNNPGMPGINVNISVMGDVKDPDALAAALRPMIASEIRTVFERLAGEGA